MAGGPPAAIQTGELVLDRYRIVEQIASGGHSVVFRGTDERLNRPVCIKIFSGLGGESGVGRTSYEHFVQEAFALSRLTHPNTLRIYDFGHLGTKDDTGMPLQVCEYMNGGTLSQIVREQGTQSVAETARLVVAMCASLGEAHSLGIVHRDIKPQNILYGTVGGNRLPKLADFGIAKWSADDEERKDRKSKRAEDTAIVAGQKLAMYSPSWAAPEQLAGQPVSPATDIYSLAAVAVYMLSTKAIFADEDVYAGYKKRRHGAQLVREALVPHGVPAPVVEVLVKALAFDPKQRPGTVEELVTELHAAMEPATDEQASLPTGQFNGDTTALLGTHKRMPSHSDLVTPPTPPTPTGALAATPPAIASAAAPTPPAVPPAAVPPPVANQWTPPVVVPPWMLTAVKSTGAAYRLALSETPTHVSERRVHFVMATQQFVDLAGTGAGQKVRITLLPSPTGRVVHLKGMTCFVAFVGGRPSPAVTLEHASDVALVTARAQEVGHIRISFGEGGTMGQLAFPLGAGVVAVGADDCADPILFDFGPGSDAYFVYTRGRVAPKARR